MLDNFAVTRHPIPKDIPLLSRRPSFADYGAVRAGFDRAKGCELIDGLPSRALPGWAYLPS